MISVDHLPSRQRSNLSNTGAASLRATQTKRDTGVGLARRAALNDSRRWIYSVAPRTTSSWITRVRATWGPFTHRSTVRRQDRATLVRRFVPADYSRKHSERQRKEAHHVDPGEKLYNWETARPPAPIVLSNETPSDQRWSADWSRGRCACGRPGVDSANEKTWLARMRL